jgi:hypothetical protein
VAQAVLYVVPAAMDNSQASEMCMSGPVVGASIVGTEGPGLVEGQHDWHWNEDGEAAEVRTVACAAVIVKGAVDMTANRMEVHIPDGEALSICHHWKVR